MADITHMQSGQMGEVNIAFPLCDGNQIHLIAPTKLSEEAWAQFMALLSVLRPSVVEPKVTGFEVHLVDYGERKISIIKEVRGFSGMGLKEAKDLVERSPSVVWEGRSKTRAMEITQALRNQGATVTLDRKHEDGLEAIV